MQTLLQSTEEFDLVTVGSRETIDEYLAAVYDDAVAEMKRFIAISSSTLTPQWGVYHGYPPAVLREKAHERNADLIVVEKHGKSPYLIGSVTEHVLAEIPRDVLVV